jgi:hypothetical protein
VANTTLTGDLSLFKFDTDGGGSPVTTFEQLTATLNLNRDIIETTSKDDGQVKKSIYGNHGWDGTFNANIDSKTGGDTTGQILIQNAIINGDRLEFQLTESGTGLTYDGDVLFASVAKTFDQNGAQVLTAAFTGTEDLTIT